MIIFTQTWNINEAVTHFWNLKHTVRCCGLMLVIHMNFVFQVVALIMSLNAFPMLMSNEKAFSVVINISFIKFTGAHKWRKCLWEVVCTQHLGKIPHSAWAIIVMFSLFLSFNASSFVLSRFFGERVLDMAGLATEPSFHAFPAEIVPALFYLFFLVERRKLNHDSCLPMTKNVVALQILLTNEQ